MLLKNPLQDFWSARVVPDGIGIDHEVRPVVALLQASGLVDADHVAADAMLSQLLLKDFLQDGFAGGIAGAARVTWASEASALGCVTSWT